MVEAVTREQDSAEVDSCELSVNTGVTPIASEPERISSAHTSIPTREPVGEGDVNANNSRQETCSEADGAGMPEEPSSSEEAWVGEDEEQLSPLQLIRKVSS